MTTIVFFFKAGKTIFIERKWNFIFLFYFLSKIFFIVFLKSRIFSSHFILKLFLLSLRLCFICKLNFSTIAENFCKKNSKVMVGVKFIKSMDNILYAFIRRKYIIIAVLHYWLLSPSSLNFYPNISLTLIIVSYLLRIDIFMCI